MFDLFKTHVEPTQQTIYDTGSLTLIEEYGRLIEAFNKVVKEFNDLEEKTEEDKNDVIKKMDRYLYEMSHTIEKFKNYIVQFDNMGIGMAVIKEQAQFIADLAKRNTELINGLTIVSYKDLRLVNLVTKYGLKGDYDPSDTTSGTDNYEQFQLAVNEMALAGGGFLYLPKGKYKLNKQVNWKSNVSLIGDGDLLTTLYPVGKYMSAIGFDRNLLQTGYSWNNTNFSNFGIDGSGVVNPEYHVGSKGIFIQSIQNSYFRDIYMKNIHASALGIDFLNNVTIDHVNVDRAGAGVTALTALGGSGIGIGTNLLTPENFTISNCVCTNCGKFGIFVEGQMDDITETAETLERRTGQRSIISNCITTGNAYGLGVWSTRQCNVVNCQSDKNVYDGLFVKFSDDVIIGQSSFRNNGMYGLQISRISSDKIIIENNTMSDNQMGISISHSTNVGKEVIMKHVTIRGNDIHDNTVNGIFINGDNHSDYMIINSNNIYDNGNEKTSGNSFGITISGDGYLNDSIIYNNFIGNIATKKQRLGIALKSNTKNLKIFNNTLMNHRSSDFYKDNEKSHEGLEVFSNYPASINQQKVLEVTSLQGANVSGYNLVKVNSSSGEEITTIGGGYNGEVIRILNVGSDFYLKTNGNIKHRHGTRLTIKQFEVVTLICMNNVWYLDRIEGEKVYKNAETSTLQGYDISDKDTIKFTNGASNLQLTSLAGGVDGERVTIINTGNEFKIMTSGNIKHRYGQGLPIKQYEAFDVVKLGATYFVIRVNG